MKLVFVIVTKWVKQSHLKNVSGLIILIKLHLNDFWINFHVKNDNTEKCQQNQIFENFENMAWKNLRSAKWREMTFVTMAKIKSFVACDLFLNTLTESALKTNIHQFCWKSEFCSHSTWNKWIGAILKHKF